MESITSLIGISIGAVLINNFVLSRFLGLCPFSVYQKALQCHRDGNGCDICHGHGIEFHRVINSYILVKFGVDYLQTIVFILVIAALVQLVEMALQKYSPALYEALGYICRLLLPTAQCLE